MGKRYFCDYCDRTFQDNLHNRKKHLNGVQHLRAKKVWYDLFRDAATILQEEQTKKPCRKFLQTGHCDFGSNCRFSHMTGVDLEKLNMQVQDFACHKVAKGDDVTLGHSSSRKYKSAAKPLNFDRVKPTWITTTELWNEIQEERRAKEGQQDGKALPAGTVEEWLEKHAKRRRAAQTDSPLSEEELVFQYPPGWPPVQELPPSLRAPPPGGWTIPPGLHWG